MRGWTLDTGERCRIREAAPIHAAEILHLTRSVLEDSTGMVSEPDEFDVTLEQEREWIERHARHPDWIALVARVETRIAGLINFRAGGRRRLAHTGGLGMCVAREWRGRGIGEALLRALLDWARENPRIEKVCLSVLADNEPAIALYEKLGFVVEGRRVRQVKRGEGEYVDDVLMYRFVDEPEARVD